MKCLQLREIRKQKCHLKYLLKRIKMKIKFVMLIVFLFLALHNERFSSNVSQECSASSFIVTELNGVDVEWMGGKKMCQLHRAI